MSNDLPTDNPNIYEWKITDETTISRIRQKGIVHSPHFKMHGMTWFLDFHPDFIRAPGTAVIFANLDKAAVLPEIKQIDYNITYSVKTKGEYSVEKEVKDYGFAKGTCLTSDVVTASELTFRVQITLNAVYSKNNEDITWLYLNNNMPSKPTTISVIGESENSSDLVQSVQPLIESMDSLATAVKRIQHTMDAIQSRMDSERKENIDDMKGTLQKFSDTLHSVEEDEGRVLISFPKRFYLNS